MSSNAPTLRAGRDQSVDIDDAHARVVSLSCVAEVFRSAYATAEVYAQHSSALAVTRQRAQKRCVARLPDVNVEDLVHALHREVVDASAGSVAQIKPLFAFIAETGRAPSDATQLVPVEWLRRVVQHYAGVLPYAQQSNALGFSNVMMTVMLTGKTATQIDADERNGVSHWPSSSSSSSCSSDEVAGSGDDDSTSEDQGRDLCLCAVCCSIRAANAVWGEWVAGDAFDDAMKRVVDDVERALLAVADMIDCSDEEDDEEGAAEDF